MGIIPPTTLTMASPPTAYADRHDADGHHPVKRGRDTLLDRRTHPWPLDVGLYLPISPYISLYLPISPYISRTLGLSMSPTCSLTRTLVLTLALTLIPTLTLTLLLTLAQTRTYTLALTLTPTLTLTLRRSAMVVSSATSALSNLDAAAESHRRALGPTSDPTLDPSNAARTQEAAPTPQRSRAPKLQPRAPRLRPS